MNMLPMKAGHPVGHNLDVMQLADVIATTGWFAGDTRGGNPKQLHAQTVVKLLWGAELGLGPIASVQGIDVIQGRPAPSGGLIAAQVDAHPRYAYHVVRRTSEACVIAWYGGSDLDQRGPFVDGRSPEAPPYEGLRPGVEFRGLSKFDVEDARKAGLAGKQVWKQYGRAMLFNRAISEGQRVYAPSLWGGSKAYTPDELGGDLHPDDVAADVRQSEVVQSSPAQEPPVQYDTEPTEGEELDW